MVARTDLRPTRADDSLKKLLNKVANPQTVPHGVKVAQPGEYVSFYDTTGTPHRWDGDTIADFDSRIEAGKQAIAETQSSLEQARADLEEAKSRIQASSGDFSQYADRITASEQKLQAAIEAQKALEGTLFTTKEDVRSLTDKASTTEADIQRVGEALSNVEAVAQDAQEAATQAQGSANEVSAQAENAVATASQALSEARAPVTVERLVVNSDLASRVVNAMTAQVKNLVVTEAAILQHTTLLGETVAEQLNVTKKLVARDAIVNGTLDVEQLNVTEAMSAQIVSAMSVESKKLVVTEDAILNRATVVQSLVTPELIAEKINVKNLGAELVTSGAIQTDPATNRGVKITNAGVNAWDPNGVQTIRLNGANNLLMGSFQTADDSIGRIRIFNQKDPVNHSQNGFITFHAIGGTKASHGVLAYTSNQLTLSVREGNADGTMKPFRAGLAVNPEGAHLQGDLFLAGQFSKGGAIASYAISVGTLPAGKYASFTQPVPLINGQRPWSTVQPASSNFANLSVVIWTTDGKIEGRVYNNSNFAATYVWIDILTFAIER